MRADMTINSPLGPITIGEENGAIVSLRIERTADKAPANTRASRSAATDRGKVRDKDAAAPSCEAPRAIAEAPTPLLAAAAAQLDAYFYCGLKNFDLPLAPEGSAFEHAIWDLMNAIPFGETRSYGELARAATAAAKAQGLDAATVAQAVGQACGRNPIAIIQPCHRVLAAGGKVGGFSAPGGAETKLALLRHEGSVLL
jgi:methylated-DNA-[protein]-cysteine S-methyltransferase